MAKVAFLLGAPRVFGPGVAGGGAKEECAREDGGERKNFNKPMHNGGWVRASMAEFIAKPCTGVGEMRGLTLGPKTADKLSHSSHHP